MNPNQIASSRLMDNISGTISALTPSEQQEVNAEAAGLSVPQEPAQPSNAEVMKALAALSAQLSSKDAENAQLKALAEKQAAELAKKNFYKHIVGGREGIDPRTDDTITLGKDATGRQFALIRVYLNPYSSDRVNTTKRPVTDKDGRIVKNEKGQIQYQKFINHDLGITQVQESTTSFRMGNGEEVTLQGYATISVGRFTSQEVDERSEKRDSMQQEQKLGDKEVSEDGTATTGSDTNPA